MLSPLLLKVFGALVLLIGTFAAGGRTAHKFDTAALAKVQAEMQKKYEEKDLAYNQIANDYEKVKALNEQTIAQRRTTVTRIVKAPIYRNVCLDADGLSVANSALKHESANPRQPDTTLPSSGTVK